MNSYLIDVTEQTHHVICVKAEDEHEALKLAQLQLGEIFERTETKLIYKKPRLLEAD